MIVGFIPRPVVGRLQQSRNFLRVFFPCGFQEILRQAERFKSFDLFFGLCRCSEFVEYFPVRNKYFTALIVKAKIPQMNQK